MIILATLDFPTAGGPPQKKKTRLGLIALLTNLQTLSTVSSPLISATIPNFLIYSMTGSVYSVKVLILAFIVSSLSSALLKVLLLSTNLATSLSVSQRRLIMRLISLISFSKRMACCLFLGNPSMRYFYFFVSFMRSLINLTVSWFETSIPYFI